MSFSFGSTPKTAASSFTLPTNPSTTAASTLPSFQFGTGSGDNKTPTKPTTGLFGAPSATPTTGLIGTPTASATSFSLGGIASTPQAKTSAPTLTFGTPGSTASGGTSLSASVPSTSSTTQFSFGSKTPSTTTTASFTPILGSTAPVTSSTGFSLTATPATTATTTTAAKLTFGLSSTTTVTTSATTSLLPTSTVASTNVTSSTGSVPTTSMTFAQLEDSINKWTIDLEEQGKFFINQAKQLNAWDALLISNGEKILELNSGIGRVKQQQRQLDQELDFILAQQKELEELLAPLEKELVEQPVTDIDRNQMYQFSEVIDSQLKQMSDDLKEIIEHINESNKEEESSNPVTQISRILNAHMNSLQWIDRNTTAISAHLEQLNKLQDANRRNFALNHSLNHSFNM
ncbi:unnamed protein product [Callosobruchus maculatus]|nr:unnamed protein product [Callosobruchus maculatus]